jgi:hypothetical protein
VPQVFRSPPHAAVAAAVESLLDVTDDQLRRVDETLNHRPGKQLVWKTPYEVFFKTKTQLIVALGS